PWSRSSGRAASGGGSDPVLPGVVAGGGMDAPSRSMRRHDSALRATLTGVLDRMGSAPPLALDARDRLDGRRCLVTGATRGLGLAVATELARRGAGLVLLGRSDLERARQTVMAAARTEVIAERVDLADLQAIERF